jgi:ABC-2 type transport system ATP-binding protein
MPGEGQASWAVESEGLGRSFGRSKVLAEVSFRVREGEIFGLLGADGAGKTTLMQMLAAILDPSEGRCRVLGYDTVREASSITSRIGYMSQGFTLYDRLSVDENLAFFAAIRGVRGAVWRQRKRRLLAMAGLEEFADRRAGKLSGGMRKKLSLCTNLIHQPPLLLLDEPSLGVDPASRRELWEMLRAFRGEGKTVVFTTTYMDEADNCDRLAFLDQGRILTVGTPADLRGRQTGPVFEVETTDPARIQAVLQDHPEVVGVQWLADRLRFQIGASHRLPERMRQQLSGLGGEIRQVSASLDDLFIQLTGGEKPVSVSAMPIAAAPDRPAPAAAAIRVEGLTCRFGAFTAVDDVSLEVRAGEVFGFLGPNGAGKTTLIRALCGLIEPAEGDAWVAGVHVGGDPRRLHQRIGYMSQRFSLYPDMTVAENLAFFAGVYGLRRAARDQAIGWARETTGLAGMDQRVARMSGAMRQRLALACSILHRPAVLFLDEPTSGVAPLARHRFWQLILTLASQGVTVLVTTHYLQEASYCHRLGLMFQGRLVACGTVDELAAGLPGDHSGSIEEIFLAYVKRERQTEARP